MSSVRSGAVAGDIARLFEGDSVAALGEGELLDRFATRGDSAAFEALVARHGPMVLGVCRRVLADPHAADDAFQATFLVLVRRASAIRRPDLLAPWLHGVALKVARRARSDAARRAARERASAAPKGDEGDPVIESGWREVRAVIDEEIGRLPEAHRRAVVLCDVEGLSREEAARRLGWTANMVRGRLERARVRLRERLARRGVAPPGAWMAWVAGPTPSPGLLSTTARAASSYATGRIGAGAASAPAVALAQGVLHMMILSKLSLGLAVALSACLVLGGSGLIAAQKAGDAPAPSGAKAATPPPASAVPDDPDPFRARPAAELARARVDAALARYKTQHAYYDEGRITVDRLVDASRGLMQAELEAGRATEADVSEIRSARLDTEFALAAALETPEAAKPAAGSLAEANRRIDELELKVDRLLKALDAPRR